MNLDPHLAELFNAQLNTELGNADTYTQLAIFADNLAWDGFAKFLYEYGAEENVHAKKISDFMVDRNCVPIVSRPSPGLVSGALPSEFIMPALEGAHRYTDQIKQLYKECQITGDDEACVFVQWYLTEQRRVERVLFDLMQQITRAGDDQAALMAIDESLK
jgi:ferritin